MGKQQVKVGPLCIYTRDELLQADSGLSHISLVVFRLSQNEIKVTLD